GETQNQKLRIDSYKNNLTSFTSIGRLELDLMMNSYSLVDINNDNKIDLIINGSNANHRTVQLTNKSNFQFTLANPTIPALKITQQAWADFNLDGEMDCIVGGADFLKIFQATGTGYVLKLDSTNLKISSILTMDVSKDGKPDIILSGSKQGKEFMAMVQSSDGFKFEFIPIFAGIDGNLESGDLNNDGFFDVVCSSESQLKIFTNNTVILSPTDSIFGFRKGELKVANFNSDSLVELSFNGKTAGGSRANFIKRATGSLTYLDTAYLSTQRWGDYDRDGDLDLLQVSDSARYQVFRVLENTTTTKNQAPPAPDNCFIVNILNKTIIRWSSLALDDHTPIKSITYDLQLTSGNKTIVNPSFDIATRKRLTLSHGNQSTRNAIIIKNQPEGFNCNIQSVDNAFVGSKEVLPCSGLPPCQETVVETRQLCRGSIEKITTPEPAHWFSFKKGYLGLQFQTVPSGLTFIADHPDTLVSVIHQNGAQCAMVHAYIIQINEPQKQEEITKFVCFNSTIQLGITPGWSSVKWTFGNITSTKDTVSITVKKDMPVTVEATSANNTCKYKKIFNLKMSDFELRLENDHYVILQGESAQLGVTGGEKYEWLPNIALNNNRVANPVASPLQTTVYEVTGSDSLGCTKKAAVKIEVVNTGFLPTMFTPNGDGKNDDFKILGLSGPSEFEFIIYNREGNIVYETSNWQMASSTGWNGQKNGVTQPSGLYYWKVTGKQPNGQVLLLNGKSSGSVLLVR
ncbi:MAG: gliding motility-associated C-terminal domain-containing protein, partial [Flammeovirgaceae bacterium]